MTTFDVSSFLALCGMAAALGVRHGFDADHLAVIDGIARQNMQTRPVIARLTGVLFCLGHSAVVMLAAVAALALASRWRIPDWLEAVGAIVSIVFLLGLAALNLGAAWTTPRSQVVRPLGFKAGLFNIGCRNGLTIALVGVLFALSFDTLSIAAAISLAAAHFGSGSEVVMAAGCFCVGMLFTSGLNGFWISHLIRSSNRRAAANSRVMTAVVGLLNLAVGLLALATLVSAKIDIWSKQQALGLGLSVIACVGLAFAAVRVFNRLPRTPIPQTGLGFLIGCRRP